MENNAPSGGLGGQDARDPPAKSAGGQEAAVKCPPMMATEPGYWSTGLFDCFTHMESCCLVFWCPCVAFGQMSEIIDKGTTSSWFNGGMYLVLCSLGMFGSVTGLPMGLEWVYSCTYRGKLKYDLNMPPSCAEECCVHYWCEPCALCQEYRELQHRGYIVSLGWNGNMEKRRNQEMTSMEPPSVAPAMDR